MATKTVLTAVRLPEEERKMLDDLAKRYEHNLTTTVRMAVAAMEVVVFDRKNLPKDVRERWRQLGVVQ